MALFPIFYVYQIGDFNTSGLNIAPPNEQGSIAAGSPPFNLQLNSGATSIPNFVIDDDDPNFQETNGADNSQLLANPVTIDGVTYPALSHVILNYELTTDDGFTGYSITINSGATGGNTGSNTTTAFITTEPMVPGQSYVFTSETNIGGGAGRTYAPFVCFVAGGRIDTPDGPRLVEDLQPGDVVLTKDAGPCPIMWVGRRTVPGIGPMAPIEFAKGVLGATGPTRVSPQHRVLLDGRLTELYCGEAEMLAAATHLVRGTRIRRVETGFVTYVHIALDHHAPVCVDGLSSETLCLGPNGVGMLTAAQKDEISALFPGVATDGAMPLSRPQASRREALILASAA